MFLPSLISLLNADTLEFLEKVWVIFQRFLEPRGLYEVLDYHVILELHDPSGKKASYRKQEKVRFLQDNIVAYQDQAWGDGDIFAEYQCSPGIPVDRYQDGHRWRVLISLRETKNKGDTCTFLIEREIRHGFIRSTEYLQSRFDHHTKQAQLQIIFPVGCSPKKVLALTENQGISHSLGLNAFQTLPDGRQQVSWTLVRPRRSEIYTLQWVW